MWHVTHHDEAVFTRDGHISELTANGLLLGELTTQAEARVRRHLADCRDCQGYVDRLQQFDGDVAACIAPRPPASPLGAAHSRAQISSIAAARRRRALRGVGVLAAAVAMAAAAVLLVRGERGGPITGASELAEIRAKASDLDMALFADGAAGRRRLYDRDRVHPGERIGFKIYTRRAGYLLIAGVDERGNVYLCYPQNSGGQAQAVTEQRAGIALDQAIRLDDILGDEHIVALLCPEPIAFSDIAEVLATSAPLTTERLPTLRPECLQRALTLSKVLPATKSQ